MKIAIYNNGIAFDGDTPSKQPLGGSESGIVYMARELGRCGHTVSVYCNCSNPGLYDGIEYAHYHRFFTDYQRAPWDAVIAFRSFDPMLLGRIAPRMLFWTGDAANQPCLENLDHPALQQNVDLTLCVSKWHRDSFIRRFGLHPDKVLATRNGFAVELAHPSTRRGMYRSAYTSTPFRGLELLLQFFAEIRRRAPRATLDVFSSMAVYGWTPDRDRAAFGGIYDAANQPGVTWRRSVSQPVLLNYLAETGLLLYPNTFEETSCIAAIEAQASGCVVVTSARAGLKETVLHNETGICIEGDPCSQRYRKEFIDAACGVMTNPELFARLSAAARDRAFRLYSWRTIAAEWTGILNEMPAVPVSGRFSGPLSLIDRAWEYVRGENKVAAQRILAEVESTPFLKGPVEGLRNALSEESAPSPVAHGGA